MQIAPVSFMPATVAGSCNVAAAPNDADASNIADNVCLSSGKAEDILNSKVSAMPASAENAEAWASVEMSLPRDSAAMQAEVTLADIFSRVQFENSESFSDIRTEAGKVSPSSYANAGSDVNAVGGFLLADGNAVGSVGVSTFASEAVPGLADVKDYRFLEPSQAESVYNEKVRDHLNPLERATIKAYSTVAYPLMNGYLLGLKSSPTGAVKMACKCLAKTLNKFEVPSGSILYRTAELKELCNYVSAEDFAKFEHLDNAGQTEKLAQILDLRLTGTQTTRKSCISTTIDPKYNFKDHPKVATKLYIGDNVKGVFSGGDKRLSPFPEESEYLLAPGTKATVMGVEYDAKNKGLVLSVFLGDLPERA